MRESSPPEAMRASGRASSPALPEKRNSAWSTPLGPSRHPSGPTAELPVAGPLPGQPHPEHRALEVERGELRQHGGLEPADGLIAPLGEVGGARDELGAEPLHALHQPALVLAGAREPLQVGLEPRPERQDRLHALPVLPLEAPDLVQPPLDRVEPRRVEDDAVAVAPERPRGLVQVDERGVERLNGRLDRRVDPRQVAKQARRAARPLDGRGGVVVELPVGAGGALGQALGVHEPPALLAKLLLLARPEPRGVDLRHGLPVLGRPGHLVASRRAERVELRRGAAPLLVTLAQPVAEDPEAREGVQEVEVAGGPEQRLVLVLAVDLDQGLAEPLQEGQRGVGVVEEHPPAAARARAPAAPRAGRPPA